MKEEKKKVESAKKGVEDEFLKIKREYEDLLIEKKKLAEKFQKLINSKDLIEEEKQRLEKDLEKLRETIKDDDNPDFIKGGYFALIIANANYEDERIRDLRNPIKDSQKFVEVLTKNYTFDKKNVIFLKDPTNDRIISKFVELISKLTEDDNLLIFHSGHGYYDKDIKQGFWWSKDAVFDKQSTWLSNGAIRDYIRGIKAKHIFLIVDSCYSGSLIAHMKGVKTVIKRFYELPSRNVLASDYMGRVPDNGVFVNYLIKILKETENKYLYSFELCQSVIRAVSVNSVQTPLYGVLHGTGDEGGEFVFVRREETKGIIRSVSKFNE